ncbi:MAG TPA: hypothetical protein VGB85_32505 [Nannocystis sp.]|jgi:hypothetical protein
MTLPILAVRAETRAELGSFDAAFASLNKYFDVVEAAEDADIAAADAVIEALDGLEHSSDIDSAYFACTLTAPELGSDEFFAATGIGRDERQSVGGYDNPKLAVITAGDGEDERPPVLLITWLNNIELEDAAEYVGDEGVVAAEQAAAVLARSGKIQGVQICTDDRATKFQMVVAKQRSGVYAGVLTVSVET